MLYITNNRKQYNIVNGIILLIIGLIIYSNPIKLLEIFIGIIAVCVLIYGIINISNYRLMHTIKYNQPWILAQGVLNILFALIVLFSLNFAAIAIMMIIGTYIIVLSVLKIMQGIKLKKYDIVHWETKIIMGLIGLFFGLLLFIYPAIVPTVLSLLLITFGLMIIINSLIHK